MSASTAALLEARALSRSHGNVPILSEVDLIVQAGSATAIVGPSGSGKTTLLSLLALLLTPSSGQILIRGEDAATLSDAARSRLRNRFYGSIFQAAHLIGSLTVLDNVLVPAHLSGEGKSRKKAAREHLERLGLGERIHFLPHQLSLGQKRRAALARALVMEPPVILADEPTNDLDPALARQIGDFLLALPREGHALLLVTHDPALADRVGERRRIEQGRLLPADVPIPFFQPL